MHCFVVVCCGHCTVAILLLLCTAEIESKWKGWYRIERWSNGIFWISWIGCCRCEEDVFLLDGGWDILGLNGRWDILGLNGRWDILGL